MPEQPYRRTIRRIASTTTAPDAPARDADLRAWLESAAKAHWPKAEAANPVYLLAHSDAAVIWGLYDGKTLALSSDDYGPVGTPLHQNTLHMARLFDPEAELRLWRMGEAWRVSLTRDGAGGEVEVIDEAYLLWGSAAHPDDKPASPFRLLAEGTQGIVHGPPIHTAPSGTEMEHRDARLTVRHYLAEDEAGVARIAYSRLLNLLSPGA